MIAIMTAAIATRVSLKGNRQYYVDVRLYYNNTHTYNIYYIRLIIGSVTIV